MRGPHPTMMIRRCRPSCRIHIKSCSDALQLNRSSIPDNQRRLNYHFSLQSIAVEKNLPFKSISNGQPLILCPTFHQKRSIQSRSSVRSDFQRRHPGYEETTLGKRNNSSNAIGLNEPERHQDIDVQFDFFSEPITFLSSTNVDLGPQDSHSSTNEAAIEALDTFLINVLTRGKSSKDGGDGEGQMAKAVHSTAIVWSDIIRHLTSKCRLVTDGSKIDGETSNSQNVKLICDAPMMAAVAFSPLLTQTSAAYLVHLSNEIASSNSKFKANLYEMAKVAAAQRDNTDLTYREQMHLTALSHLLENNPHAALNALLTLLDTSPGDLFAYTLVLDLSQLLCQPHQAERATMALSTYWNERSNESFTMQSGYGLASSLLSYGLACSGGYATHGLAEPAAAAAIKGGLGNIGGGNCAAALAGVYSAEGRVSEGTSVLSKDGVEDWESCGFLFWNVRLMGKGGGFVLSRDGAGRENSALRMYDGGFGWALESGGYVDESINTYPIEEEVEGEVTDLDDTMRIRKVPMHRRDKLMKSAGESASSMWSSLFCAGNNKEDEESLKEIKTSKDESVVTLEDILTWLPPTTTMLTEATFLLFRLTLCGAITGQDGRWFHLRAGWERTIDMERKVLGTTPLTYSPLARIACSLVMNAPEDKADDEREKRVSFRLEKAARIMGNVMDLGRSKGIDNTNNEVGQGLKSREKKEWKEVVQLLTIARSGWSSSDETGTDVVTPQLVDLNVATVNTNEELHQFFGHALCHAALELQDYDTLHVARAVCSATVTLRPNKPEGWRMYSQVLEALGDSNAAQDAMNAAVSLGSGEGGRPGSM